MADKQERVSKLLRHAVELTLCVVLGYLLGRSTQSEPADHPPILPMLTHVRVQTVYPWNSDEQMKIDIAIIDGQKYLIVTGGRGIAVTPILEKAGWAEAEE